MPRGAQLRQGFDQLLAVDRLDQEPVHPGFEAGVAMLHQRIRGQRKDRRAAARLTGYTTDYDAIPIAPAARASLRPGKNVLAIHCHQTRGGQYVDAGLVEVREAR